MISPYLKAVLKLAESQHWISNSMWERIISNADEETLAYLRNEAMPNWKLFTREDWMRPSVKEHLFDLAGRRLADLQESSILHKFFDGVADFLL